MSELGDLIREQAHDMRNGHRLRRQGDAWMHAVVSLDSGLIERLDNHGRVHRDHGGIPWGCAYHGLAHATMDSMGRPQCAECHRANMRAYSASAKGRAREKAYRARPGVREKRLEQQRARRRRLREAYQSAQ